MKEPYLKGMVTCRNGQSSPPEHDTVMNLTNVPLVAQTRSLRTSMFGAKELYSLADEAEFETAAFAKLIANQV